VVSNANAGLILNHMRGTPGPGPAAAVPDVMGLVRHDSKPRFTRPAARPWITHGSSSGPRVRLGKRGTELRACGAPRGVELARNAHLAGPFRAAKNFLKQRPSARRVRQRRAVTAAILAGATWCAVHDVEGARPPPSVADAVARVRPAGVAWAPPGLRGPPDRSSGRRGRLVEQCREQILRGGARSVVESVELVLGDDPPAAW